MSHQLTVRLSENLSLALASASAQMQRKRSEIVRMALQQYLGLSSQSTRPVDRVRHLLGSLETGVPDLAENHRSYVLESLKNGR
jgi:hypothetical protein